MKQSTFTKALLCGVLATSFMVFSCQKAPEKAAAKAADQTAKPQVAPAKLEDCSADAITALTARKAALENVKNLLKAGDKTEAIQNAIKDLNDKQKAADAQISKNNADGCTQADPAKPDEKVTYEKVKMTEENRKVAKAVRGLTLKGNVILDEAGVVVPQDTTRIFEKDTLIAGADAAKLEVGVIVSKGAILSADAQKTAKEAGESLCEVKAAPVDADDKIKEKDELKVETLTNGADGKVTLSLLGKKVPVSLECSIAKGKDAGQELLNTLKGLLNLKVIEVKKEAPKGDDTKVVQQ